MSKDFEEKRKEPRFPINATVKLVCPSLEDVVYGVCSDVSKTGLKIITNSVLPFNETLSIEITEKGTTFNAEGEVAYCAENPDNKYDIGLKTNFEPPLPQ